MGLTQVIGNRGEDAACEWLLENGFEVVARNWRSGRYEIDVVAVRFDTLHFVEVKTRALSSMESPEDAMTAAKQRSFRAAVRAYLALQPSDLEPQLDLIAIDTAPSGHIEELRYIPHAVLSRW